MAPRNLEKHVIANANGALPSYSALEIAEPDSLTADQAAANAANADSTSASDNQRKSKFLVLASVLGSFALYTTHAQYGGAAPVPILGQSGGSPGGAGATPCSFFDCEMNSCPLPVLAPNSTTPSGSTILCTDRDTPAYLKCSSVPFNESDCNNTCSIDGCSAQKWSDDLLDDVIGGTPGTGIHGGKPTTASNTASDNMNRGDSSTSSGSSSSSWADSWNRWWSGSSGTSSSSSSSSSMWGPQASGVGYTAGQNYNQAAAPASGSSSSSSSGGGSGTAGGPSAVAVASSGKDASSVASKATAAPAGSQYQPPASYAQYGSGGGGGYPNANYYNGGAASANYKDGSDWWVPPSQQQQQPPQQQPQQQQPSSASASGNTGNAGAASTSMTPQPGSYPNAYYTGGSNAYQEGASWWNPPQQPSPQQQQPQQAPVSGYNANNAYNPNNNNNNANNNNQPQQQPQNGQNYGQNYGMATNGSPWWAVYEYPAETATDPKTGAAATTAPVDGTTTAGAPAAASTASAP